MNKIQAAEHLRRAVQLLAGQLEDEQALEIPSVFPAWTPGAQYEIGDLLTYGENPVGDPQIYRAAQGHASQADRLPTATPALYTAIGLTSSGRPIWAQPTGAHDAYNIGDVVSHQGVLYESLIDGNTTEPGTDERWWKLAET